MHKLETILILIMSLFVHNVHAQWYSDQQDIMGTRIQVELEVLDSNKAGNAMAAVMAEMRRIDALMSPYIDESELSTVNKTAGDHPVTISQELYGLLDQSVDYSRLTDGAFDITFASIGFYYDYRRSIKPDHEQIDGALEYINYRNLQLEPSVSSVSFESEGVKIDLGGIAKGYAVDRCIDILRDMGIENARVTAGGDTRVIGSRWGRPWHIGIRDPRRSDEVLVMVPLENVAISTSGDYERFFEQDGQRYHHIIDPKTGDSARELQSVTIIGDEATTTDALSTSVFVLGVKSGMALIEGLHGIDAILVDSNGNLHYTSGLLSTVTMQ